MCGIAGWFNVPEIFLKYKDFKTTLLTKGSIRGRDGWGFRLYRNENHLEMRDLKSLDEDEISCISSYDKVIGCFRATPTTEALSKIELLQPYDGVVHNGTISNDKKYGDYPIDSMILPSLVLNKSLSELVKVLGELEGSFAIGFFEGDYLTLTCNYKPIYFYTDWSNFFLFGSLPEMLPSYSSALKPYSIMRINIKTFEREEVDLPRQHHPGVVVSASSGLDSTTVAYLLKSKGMDVTLAHFKYGCVAESKEIQRIRKIAEHGNFSLTFLDLPRVFGGTIVEGDYCKDGIKELNSQLIGFLPEIS
jgi:asparagine synthetase B (glutamine-hydrolysing)